MPLPEVLAGKTLTLEDQTLETRGLDDSLPHRSFVWLPSIKTIAGGVNVYAGLHLWDRAMRRACRNAPTGRKHSARWLRFNQ